LNPNDPNCPSGGTAFTAADGTITYACNGASGAAGATGATGPQGAPGRVLNPLQVATLHWYEVNQAGVSLAIPGGVTGMGFDGNYLWVAGYGCDCVVRVRPSDATDAGYIDFTNESYAAHPVTAYFDGTRMWVASSAHVFSFDKSASLAADINSLDAGGPYVGQWADGITSDGTNLWVAIGGGSGSSLVKFNPLDGGILGTYPVEFNPNQLAFDGTDIWATIAGGNQVHRLVASNGNNVGTIAVGSGASSGSGIAYDGAYMWISNSSDNTVHRIRASDLSDGGVFPVGTSPLAVLFDGANVWVANYGSNSVTKLRASDGALIGTYPVANGPWTMAFDGINLWVGTGQGITKL